MGSAFAICPKSDECDGDGCYHHGKHKRRKDCTVVNDDCPKCESVSAKVVHSYEEEN